MEQKQSQSEAAVADILMDDERQKDLKIEINELIWRYGPENLTLGKAEEIALKMLKMIMEG